jgi:copper homeostasis protein
MTQKYALEISVETLEAAKAAERGGADRIELCGNLSVGGVTPSAELMRAVRAQIRIPIFVMIRPRAGDFVYSNAEFAEMKRSIADAKESRMHGVVLGVLTKDRRVDVARTRELVEFAKPLTVTYHRAFDETPDLREALEDVIKTGASRILTSGGAKTAAKGAVVLCELIAAAENRIIIIPGAGNNAANISQVAQKTRAREFHSGLSSALPYGSHDYERFEEEVRRLAEQLARLSFDESPSD